MNTVSATEEEIAAVLAVLALVRRREGSAGVVSRPTRWPHSIGPLAQGAASRAGWRSAPAAHRAIGPR